MAKQITVNPIETAVAEYLKAKGITFTATGGFATKRDDWECDQWSCVFTGEDRRPLVSTYYTGIGHRVLTPMGQLEVKRAGKSSIRHIESIKRQHSKAVAPHAAGVLHSLLSDASSGEQNFHDWCDDLGFDKDSIKAQKAYNECCDTLTRMRAFFTGTERAEMQEILQDY